MGSSLLSELIMSERNESEMGSKQLNIAENGTMKNEKSATRTEELREDTVIAWFYPSFRQQEKIQFT